jgi:hypothetical protein
MDFRKHLRKFYPKQVFLSSENRYHKGFIRNISLNGAFIKAHGQFSIGQALNIFIPSSKIGNGAILKGQIVRLHQEGFGLVFKKH